jgi:D-alanine-D-alanine ligase-like ATP-grasp enzyme
MKTCKHCAPFSPHHIANWLDDLLDLFFLTPFEKVTPAFLTSHYFEKTITDLFLFIGLVRREKQFELGAVNPIAALFLERAQAKGIEVEALRGPFGYLTFFRMRLGDRFYEFDRLPGAAANPLTADDKWKVKQKLGRLGYPTAPGRAFWWFQKKRAARFAETLGYPLVVKPRKGSLSQHMFIIKNRADLAGALEDVAPYSPVFIMEKFVQGATLYRVTVVNGTQLFIVKRLPAQVTGNGKDSLQKLIHRAKFDLKNLNLSLLKSQRVGLRTVIPKGKTVLLHHKAIMALRSKIEAVPLPEVHQEILAMCRNVAAHFRLPLVGIDILLQDHRKSPGDQPAAILELNTLPNILMHTFEKNGRKENAVADALVNFAPRYFNAPSHDKTPK